MKKINKLGIWILILDVCLILLSGIACALITETIDSTGDVGRDMSIAVDSSNRPHISYYDSTNKNLKYAYKDGAKWVITTVDSTGDVGEFTSIAIDSLNRPQISYYDSTNKGLKYAYKDGAKWIITTVTTVKTSDAKMIQTSIAVDSSKRPRISYQFYGYPLMYAWKDGLGVWNREIIADLGISDESIALDSNNIPHVSYTKAEFGGGLKYAYRDAGVWRKSSITDSGGYGSRNIALDSNNIPHVSYMSSSDTLKYAYKDGATWIKTTVDSPNVGAISSIAIDSNDMPHISYRKANGDLKYAYKDGATWVITTVDSTSNFGGDTSIAVDSSNRPHISYYDITKMDLKYAYAPCPSMTEICDNIDNNCDGFTDEGCDDDNDNYCDNSMTISGTPTTCTGGGNDCDDNPATGAGVHPGATEICDGIDNNCDGTIDDETCLCSPIGSIALCEKQMGVCSGAQKTCLLTGWENCADKYKLNVNYEASETKCEDSLDNDCDGLSDCDDADCSPVGLGCATDSQCGSEMCSLVCENVCIPACTKDDDCSSEEICDISTGHCYVPVITPTECSDPSIKSSGACHTVGPFDCYWDESESSCNEITGCKGIGSDLDACTNTVKITCQWDPVSEICSSGSGGFLGCPEGKYPQVDGTCGDDVDPNLVCNNNFICDPEEVCGCGDCVHQLGAGGCDINNWCGDTKLEEIAGCVPISIGSEEKCEDYYLDLAAECLEKGGRCSNDYYLSQEPPLFSNGIVEIGEQECCIGSCLLDDGFVIGGVTGTITAYTSGDCNPFEMGSSEGNMDIKENGVIVESKPCTILPSRRVPFSSIFGVLAGLVIIVLFYLVRKKH